jgi:hypothetical protein
VYRFWVLGLDNTHEIIPFSEGGADFGLGVFFPALPQNITNAKISPAV